jgi:hypothetical protein
MPDRAPLMRDLLDVLHHAEKYLPGPEPGDASGALRGGRACRFLQPANQRPLDARLTVFNHSALGEELWPIGLHLIEQFV